MPTSSGVRKGVAGLILGFLLASVISRSLLLITFVVGVVTGTLLAHHTSLFLAIWRLLG